MSTIRHVALRLSAWGCPLAVALTLLATLFDGTTLSRNANRFAYDRFVQWDARLSSRPAQVLLVYAESELERQPAVYLRLVQALRDLGGTGLGIAQLDARTWSARELEQLTERGDVVLGAIEHSDPSRPSELPRGSIELCHDADGVYRESFGLGDVTRGSLPANLAARFGSDGLQVPAGRFGVSFHGGPESLPHVTAEAILAGDITSALVRDRVVVIGRPQDPLIPGLATPTTGSQRMTALEFHGQVLNGLLNGRYFRRLNSVAMMSVFFVAAVAFSLLGRRSHLRHAVTAFLGIWAVQAVVALAVFWWASVWAPLASLMAVEFVAGIWSVDARMRFSQQAWRIMRCRGFSVSPRYRSQPYLTSETEPWALILDFVQQLFPLDRVALLVWESGGIHLEVVATTGLGPDEVIERRRDIQRAPYSDAIDRKLAVRIDDTRPFFPTRDEQRQFLAPLLHAGQVEGVLIVEVSETALQKLAGFARQLTDVCEEIAPWLARLTELRQTSRQRTRWWNRCGMSAEAETFELLQRHLNSIERRLHESYDVIEHASSGKAVFDLSGQIVTMNAAMFRLLHGFGIASPDARLLHILHVLSKRDSGECRELVRRVLVRGRRQRLVATDAHGENAMVLIMQPLVRSAQLGNDVHCLNAFASYGIQLEIFEGDLLQGLHKVREHIAEHGLSTLENVLLEVLSLTEELEADEADPWRRQLHSSVEEACVTVQGYQSMLANEQSEAIDVCVPVDVGAVIREAVAETRSFALQRAVAVSVAIPSETPDVKANPHRLRQVLVTALELLVEHARENSVINITARNDGEQTTVQVENQGCGVVLDRLAATRRVRPDRPESDASRLIGSCEWLQAWGGELQVQSELGEGATITLRLVRFAWNDQLVRKKVSDRTDVRLNSQGR